MSLSSLSPGVHIRVIDPFTIKPLDAATIVSSARATGGRIITVEDHYKEGGCFVRPGNGRDFVFFCVYQAKSTPLSV